MAALARFAANDVRYNKRRQWRSTVAAPSGAAGPGLPLDRGKDKATLFIALAREVGRAPTSWSGNPPRRPGAQGARLPVVQPRHRLPAGSEGIAQGRFIDLPPTTAALSPLPGSGVGHGDHPGEKGFRFMTTPLSPSDDAVTRIETKVHPDGSASASVALEAQGLAAMSLRPAPVGRIQAQRPRLHRGRWLFQGGSRSPGDPAGGAGRPRGALRLAFSGRRGRPPAIGDALLLKPGGFPGRGLIAQAQRKLPLELEAREDMDRRGSSYRRVSVGRLPGVGHLTTASSVRRDLQEARADKFEVVTGNRRRTCASAGRICCLPGRFAVQHAADQPVVQGHAPHPQGLGTDAGNPRTPGLPSRPPLRSSRSCRSPSPRSSSVETRHLRERSTGPPEPACTCWASTPSGSVIAAYVPVVRCT